MSGRQMLSSQRRQPLYEEGSPTLAVSAVTARKSDIALLKASTDVSGFLYTFQQQRKAEGRKLVMVTIIPLVIQ